MAWILVAGCLLFVWITSLCRVLLVAHTCWMNSFKKSGMALRKRNVLIVIAHPDDESMFFTPTINYLTSRGHYIHIFCLSIGDADSKGSIRKQELFQACATLKVPMQQVKVVDHSELQVITFDNYGVSGHCNHRDVHYGVCKLLYDIPHREIEAWELVSTNILRKYSGPIDVWLSMFVAMLHPNETIQFLVNEHPYRSFLAMAQHSSQWVWFRKCFVAMSSYTYMNKLRKIK